MTMKMGLERKLKEKIPEIAEVVQTLPDVPEINTESVEKILNSVRPFLAVAGGTSSFFFSPSLSHDRIVVCTAAQLTTSIFIFLCCR